MAGETGLEAPDFFLYGEPPRVAEPDFLHLEPLHVRSQPSGWSSGSW